MWVGAAGASLLVFAAVIATITHWSAIPNGAKLVALWLTTAGALAASHAWRERLPIMSTVTRHLGLLLVPTAIATTAIGAGATWPTVLLAAGVGGSLTLAAASNRSATVVLDVTLTIPLSLVAVGLAAQTPIPAGVAMSIFAVGLAATHRQRGATAAGVAALVAPLSAVVCSSAINAGTLTRIGVNGHVLALAGPTTGVLVALAFALIARAKRDVVAWLGAAGSLVFGVATGFITVHAAPALWLIMPGSIWLAIELISHTQFDNITHGQERFVDSVELAIFVFASQVIFALTQLTSLPRTDRLLFVPVALIASVAAGIALVRRRRITPNMTPVMQGLALCEAVGIATAAASGWLALAALATSMMVVVTGMRLHHRYMPHFGCAAAVASGVAMGMRFPVRHWWVLGIVVCFAGAVCIAVAFWRTLRVTYLDTIGVTAVALGAILALRAPGLWAPSAWVVAGSVVAFYGMVRLQRPLVNVGQAIVFASMLAATTRLPFALPSGVTPAEVRDYMLVAAVAWWCRKSASTWARTAPWLGLLSIILLANMEQLRGQWRVVAAITAALVAIAAGGVRRSQPELVIGSVNTASIIAITCGPRLAKLPTWTWLAAGGVALLTVAYVIEHHRPDPAA